MELDHAIGLGGKVAGGAFHLHPNGETAVYALGGNVIIEDLANAHEQVFLTGHDDHVSCLALSASGRYIVSGQHGENADVLIWDYEARKIMYRMQEHDDGVKLVALTADERFLLSIGLDKKLVVYDMTTGMIVVKKSGMKPTACACWGGRRLDSKRRPTTDYQFATGGEGNLIYWSLDPMEGRLTPEECTLGNQVRNFTAIAFSFDEDYIFAGSSSSDFTAVHVKHKVLHSTTMCHSGGVHSIVAMATFDRNSQRAIGDRLIIGCGDGTISVFEGQRNGGQMCRTYQPGPAASCSIRLDGSVSALQLQVAQNATSAELAELTELKLLAATVQGSVFAVSLSVADYRAMDAPPATCKKQLESHHDAVIAIAYPKLAEQSEMFATASADGTLRVWDVNTYTVLAKGTCQTATTGKPSCIDFTGEAIFSGWADGKIRAHSAEDGQQLWEIDNCHVDGVTALQCSHNKKFLVSGGEHGEVRVWEIRTREMIVALKQHSMAVTSLVLFGDDSHVVSSSRDRTVYLWDLQTEARKASLVQKMGGFNGICILQDHVTVASVGQEKSVTYWDLREKDPLSSFTTPCEQFCIASYQMSPDSINSTVLAVGGADGVVQLWDYATGTVLSKAQYHSGAVRSMQFSPDGRQLVSVGDDESVLVWNIFLDAPAQGPAS